jgi:ankyrin repeat protein
MLQDIGMFGWFENVSNWFKSVLGPIRSTPDEQLRYICEDSGDVNQLEELLRDSLAPNTSSSPLYFPEGNKRAGYTPLTLAARSGHIQVIDYLLSHKLADVTEKDRRWGATALHHAARKNHAEIVRYLLNAGGDVNATTDTACKGATPLHWASSHGSVETAKILIDYQANINAREKVSIY